MRPKVRTALDFSKTGISGSNPIQEKNVCPHFFCGVTGLGMV
jgi:hypothetical protein